MLSNSPAVRKSAIKNGSGPVGSIMRAIHQQPPLSAVFALFRSMGYHLNKGQRGKWETSRRGRWVPFEMTKNGEEFVRWVMNDDTGHLKWSDGSDLPRKLIIGYAVVKARFKTFRAAAAAEKTERAAA